MDRLKRTGTLLLSVSLLLSGCSIPKEDLSDTQTEPAVQQRVEKADTPDINDVHIRDKDLLYERQDETSVVTMYLTVSRGNSSEKTDHTWEEINTYSAYDYDDMGVPRYQVAGLLQIGDENGPLKGELGYGEFAPNATVQIRGQTSSRRSQKNYKIELKKNKGLWNEQRTINLNKHQGDSLRFRNKLVYKLIQGIPELMGLRTQFVHLYVKDNTQGNNGKFEDYGLYTQVEQLNKTALRAHGLDTNAQLYKAEFFEFYRYEDTIRTTDDPDYDLDKFEDLLEVKGNTDHTKLIKMLDALNDYMIPIDTVLDQYFDRENLLHWMAFHILIGNVDTQSRNFFLYSPQNSDKWYFLTWDNDASLFNTEYELKGFIEKGSWESGISNYWGNILFQRCLKSATFRTELDQVIEKLKDYLNEDRIRELCTEYVQVVKPYAFQMPDRMYLNLTEEQYDDIASALPHEIEENYQQYKESLEKPMPFFIGTPFLNDGKMHIAWDPAFDFDMEDIVYTVEIAKDYRFQDTILKVEDQIVPEISVDIPPAGQYFVRIRATNSSGQTQDAFDYYVTDEGKQFGVKCFYVTPDQTIEEDVYEE